MIYLLLDTSTPQSRLWLYRDAELLQELVWQADRQLAATIHRKLDELLRMAKVTWQDLSGIGCFAGPGSFTGLRIGISVANALAYAYSLPVVAQTGEDGAWQQACLQQLMSGTTSRVAVPFYGAPATTTAPKK